MNLTYLIENQKENQTGGRLLLIFAGWSAEAELFSGIAPGGYDVAVVTDYTSLSAPWAPRLTRYGEIVVMAWSFGVPAAAFFMEANPDLRISARIAVNGTLHPVHPGLGIDPAIFRGTLDGLTDRTLRKFGIRMCGGAAAYAESIGALPHRPVEALRAELKAIGVRGDAPAWMWDKAVVSSDDAIIPPGNQKRAWSREAYETIEIDGSHLPRFDTLVASLLTDKELVGRRFSRSRHTYDGHAPVQERVARRLASLLPSGLPEGTMIEIGCGSGVSTRLLASRPDIAPRLELWDLHIPEEVRGLGNAWRECDAEAAVCSLKPESCSLIFSASTVQWFNSMAAFMRRAAEALAPGGVLAVATYGPRTMEQVNVAAGIVSRFPSAEAIRRMTPESLDTVAFETRTERLLFDTPLDVLRHISATGVNGMADGQRGASAARAMMRGYPIGPDGKAGLTYEPILFVMRKRN